MSGSIKYFDLAVGERIGNGGDIAFVKSDLAVVFGMENQTYLAMFGGNVEENTPVITSNAERFDYWANTLLFKNDLNKQYNSNTERTLNKVALNSAGRLAIESVVKDDLNYLTRQGATVSVDVRIIDVNEVEIQIETVYPNIDKKRLTIIKFGRKDSLGGDFSPLDFNEDWF